MQNPTYILYPEIDISFKNTLRVDDLHEVYYEVCGNPNGVPVVFLHGGPGSGCNPVQRRFFDPSFYLIVLIDQRGCGRSKPQGSVIKNTTADLVADIDAIRNELNIQKWLVFGGSWGSTLALSYALAFPLRVTGLILRGIFLSRPSELNWFLGDIAHFYPEVWDALITYLPASERSDVLSAYSQRLFSDDSTVNIPAAWQWNAFENSIMRLIPKESKEAETPSSEQDATEVARARIQIHYIEHQCFVDGTAILASAPELAHIPTIIVQGRYDMVCPPKSAWELSRAMPHSEFHIIQDAGHSAMEVGITSALIAATEKFKHLNSSC
ncbi:MAG: prolyl aminopeptidase [Methylophilaceae bacterium]